MANTSLGLRKVEDLEPGNIESYPLSAVLLTLIGQPLNTAMCSVMP